MLKALGYNFNGRGVQRSMFNDQFYPVFLSIINISLSLIVIFIVLWYIFFMSKLDNINILCYRWGSLYDVGYVNKLYSMVSRHLSSPFTFHCVTDSPEGLNKKIVAHELLNIGVKGNWNKLQTFKNNFLGLEGEHIICMDLDIIIVDSIDFLLDDLEKDFLIAKNWAKGMRGNSSVYRIRVGALTYVWEQFISNPEFVIENFHGKTHLSGDQRWMNHIIKEYNFFQEKKVISFKRHCKAKGFCVKLPFFGDIEFASFGSAVIPHNAAIIAFTGQPLPPDVMNKSWGRWKKAPFVQSHWK